MIRTLDVGFKFIFKPHERHRRTYPSLLYNVIQTETVKYNTQTMVSWILLEMLYCIGGSKRLG